MSFEISINKSTNSVTSSVTNDSHHDRLETVDHICDIAKGASLQKKNKSAIKHINKALSVINCPYNNIDDIPFEGFTDQLAGQVGTYMATRATRFMAEGGKKIALLTAMGYMSSFKSFCINKFR